MSRPVYLLDMCVTFPGPPVRSVVKRIEIPFAPIDGLDLCLGSDPDGNPIEYRLGQLSYDVPRRVFVSVYDAHEEDFEMWLRAGWELERPESEPERSHSPGLDSSAGT